MSDAFTPNPLFAFGRVDTSAGEGGESLHKINPALFGVDADGHIGRGSEVDGSATSEDIVIGDSALGNVPEPPEGTTVEPQFAPEGGTVDTSAPGLPVNEDGSSPLAPADVEGQLDEGESTGEAVPGEPVDPADGDQTPPSEVVDYSELLKPELIELANSRGVDASGTKADIIERLQQADAAV